MLITNEQLVSELWAQDVRFLMGTAPNHPPMLSPVDLIVALAESMEARLQLSLIPVFLRHPEFSEYVKPASEKLKPNLQLLLKCFYSASVWLEQRFLLTRSYLKNGKLALKPELRASQWTLQTNNGQW